MKKTYRMNRKLINIYMRCLKRWTVQWELTGSSAAEERLRELLDVARNRASRAGPMPGRKPPRLLVNPNIPAETLARAQEAVAQVMAQLSTITAS
jgi:hypothetical protein